MQRLAAFLSEALRPLISSLGSDGDVLAFIEELGWTLPLVPPSIPALGSSANAVIDALTDAEIAADVLADGSGDGDTLAQALARLVAALGAFAVETREMRTKLAAELPAAFVAATGIADTFQKRLFEDLVVRVIAARAPLGTALAALVGLVEEVEVEADPARLQPDYTRRTLRLDRIDPLLNDPRSLLREVYGWGTPTLDLDRLFTNVQRVSYPLLGPMEVRYPSDELLAATAPGAPIPEEEGPPPAYTIPIYEGGPITIVLAVMPLPKVTPEEAQGVAITLALKLAGQNSLTLGPLLTLTLDGTLDLASGAAAVLRPDRDPAIVLNPEGGLAPLTSKGGARLLFGQPDQPLRLLTIPGGSFLEAQQLYFTAGMDATNTPPDVYVESGLIGGTFTISTRDADGFVARILPSDGITTHFDFGAAWSQGGGLRFSGSAGLETTLALNLSLGPIAVRSIHAALAADSGSATLELSATAATTIGPIGVSVERVGIMLRSAFHDGNLGPVDLNLGFKPPSGAGLAIDAAGVTGGGFLRHDEAKHEYAGVLQLQFIDLALQAFGLITTQVAGGSGYSLLALVDAEFPPVQLGWGFTLNGVGGLLAINRTASTDALHAALKAGQLSTILFPKNAITNAPAILSQLDALFPTAPGRFLFGPMALIGWGTPTMLTASIAVVVELPEPVRVILLARIEARMPDPLVPLVRINMDALGILDLGKGELSFDAVLFDSRLVIYTMSGAMALRATWAAQREFVLAIGGFHPRFTPPAGFPMLQRMTIDMPSGIVTKLRLSAYLALTSNSIQIGANLDALIGVSGFGLSGHLGFDALLLRHPFHFEADISGSVALTAGGDDLASVSLDATLTGPAPYNIAGKFKVHVVFFDVHVSFNHSWGEDAPSLPVPSVDVGALLGVALAELDGWDALLPDGVSPLVTARRIEEAGILLAHPLARPQVHERIVPLGLAITRFGEAVPTGATTFTISNLHVGVGPVGSDPIQDDFAPAQFFELTDEEKLERPSFERHDAGLRVSGGLVASGAPNAKTTAYETFYIDTPGMEPRKDPGVVVTPPGLGDLRATFWFGAPGRAAAARRGRRYQAAGNPIRVAEPAFVLADKTTLLASGVGPATGATFSDMHALLASNRNLQIVATHEMAA